jgi:peptidoglycan/xylan/chitin deacetylase (PgdA/CDA1 family)/GT2 family glycosyltransferase
MSGRRKEIVFSVIVPTFNRRDVLLAGIESIVAAQRPWPCELIVVDDGSTDGTQEALAGLRLPLDFHPLRQDNAGAAAARNHGARTAKGRYLLFLDDDMTADPRLLVEHERSLAAGADAVVGDIPLHPDLPRTVLTRGVARWTVQRRRRLEREPGRLTVSDFLTGQLSVRAAGFTAIQGFDERLTEGGSFGGEDTDLLFRLRNAQLRLEYNGAAVSYQRYIVTPEQNVRQWWEAGRTDAVLSRKHPSLGPMLWEQHRGDSIVGRLVRAASVLPAPVLRPVRTLVTRRVRTGRMDLLTEWTYARMRDVSYWDGARTGGGLLRHGPGVRILAYHAVEKVDDPVIGRWSVDPAAFEQHLTTLLESGCTFIDADRLIARLDAGTELPERSVLLTFDDGYQSLVQHAAPILARLGIPAVVCVVTGQLGGHNAWDAAAGAVELPLLTGEQLTALSRAGWEVAAHTHSHAHLGTLPAAELREELTRPRTALTQLGLPAPRLLAYPHGEQDFRVRREVRRAGYRAALALDSRCDRYAIPRIEVRSGMTGDQVRDLVTNPARPAPAEIGRELKAAVRFAMDGVPLQRRPTYQGARA